MTSVHIARLCDELLQQVGEVQPFPRDLNALFTWALPLAVRTLPSLSSDAVRGWLAQHGIASETGPSRRLRACLVAARDGGVVLLDGSDPPDERRFSLAHEAGHFLLDYQQPRHRLLTALGPEIQPVVNGERPPNRDERVAAILAGMSLGPRLHLMERGDDGLACGAVAGSECLADEFALELLAPEAVALAMLPNIASGRPYAEREQAAGSLMRTQFGLPEPIAGRYARRLVYEQTGGPTTREWLGMT